MRNNCIAILLIKIGNKTFKKGNSDCNQGHGFIQLQDM